MPQYKTLLVDDLEIAYLDEGKGQNTLLFVHGLGTDAKSWVKVMHQLKDVCRCIAIDLPGYGGSSIGDFPFSISFFVRYLVKFCRQLQLRELVLVGHSMGGQIAMRTALDHPDLMSGVVLLAPAGIETFSKEERAYLMPFYHPALLMHLPDAQIVRNFELNFFKMPEDTWNLIRERLDMRRTAQYQHFCRMISMCVEAMLHEPVFDQLKNLSLPVRILFGKEDQLIPSPLLLSSQTTETIAIKARDAIPNSRMYLIPECGHFIPWEKPQIVQIEILSLLEKINFDKIQ